VIAIERACDVDFVQSVGDGMLSKDFVALCYAYRNLTGDRVGERSGVWHQGKKAFENVAPLKTFGWKRAAAVLHRFAKEGQATLKDGPFEWGERFIGRDTSTVEPIALSGKGREIFFKPAENK